MSRDLATANHVELAYCSSDDWSGATDQLRPTSAGDRYSSTHSRQRPARATSASSLTLGSELPLRPEADTEIGSCAYGPTWYRSLRERAPVFIQQSVYDLAYMVAGHDIDPNDPADDEAQDRWYDDMTAAFEPVDWLFSMGEPYHTITTNDTGLGLGQPPDTFIDLLMSFWNDGAPRPVLPER